MRSMINHVRYIRSISFHIFPAFVSRVRKERGTGDEAHSVHYPPTIACHAICMIGASSNTKRTKGAGVNQKGRKLDLLVLHKSH